MTAHNALSVVATTLSVVAILAAWWSVWRSRGYTRRAEEAAHLSRAAAKRAEIFREMAAQCEARVRDSQGRQAARRDMGTGI